MSNDHIDWTILQNFHKKIILKLLLAGLKWCCARALKCKQNVSLLFAMIFWVISRQWCGVSNRMSVCKLFFHKSAGSWPVRGHAWAEGARDMHPPARARQRTPCGSAMTILATNATMQDVCKIATQNKLHYETLNIKSLVCITGDVTN